MDRGFSADITNNTTVVAINALANPIDLSSNTPRFPWKKNHFLLLVAIILAWVLQIKLRFSLVMR